MFGCLSVEIALVCVGLSIRMDRLAPRVGPHGSARTDVGSVRTDQLACTLVCTRGVPHALCGLMSKMLVAAGELLPAGPPDAL